jgi:hypothetical protein
MSTEDMQLRPHKIRGTTSAWWYEDVDGICVVQEHWEGPVHISTDSITIPWRAIRGALKRLDKP